MSATQALHKAKVQLILKYVFFASILLKLKIREEPSIPTLATDGRELLYNPDFVQTLTREELTAVLAHEVMHVVLLHHTRREGRTALRWNMAADHVVNLQLQDDGLRLPEGCLADPQYKGMTTEKVYSLLPDNAGEEGSGAPQGNMVGEVVDATPGEGETMDTVEEETKAEVQQALQAARMQGKLPAGLERAVTTAIAAKVNWRDVLQQYVAAIAREDYTWRRPNARYLNTGFMFPALHSETLPPMTVAIDTSGSIGQKDLNQFAAEVQTISDQWNVQINVLYCDTRIQGEETFEKGDAIKLSMKGGGGTDFAPVMQRVREAGEPPVCLIYFTDLFCSSYGDDPGCPVLWLQHSIGGGWRNWATSPPFGDVIPMEV